MTRRAPLRLALPLVLVLAGCLGGGRSGAEERAARESAEAALRTQALVMGLADEQIAALGEAVYLLPRGESFTPRARALAQSFLRNGVGACIDIGAGPNPPVDLLDLLVLAALQTWSFEAHWMPAGIGEDGRPALERLARSEAALWEAARAELADDQLDTLRQLVDAWIEENPDRTVVALVRFDEFGDERKLSSLALREEAGGLLREVSEATGAIDDARLLGERALWYAGRYPYVLGEQAELTAFRLLDQPEGRDVAATLESVRALSDSLGARADTLGDDLTAQREALFEEVAAERALAIDQAQAALAETVTASIEEAAVRFGDARAAAVDDVFDRLAAERGALLADLDAREGRLRELLVDLDATVASLDALARASTGTAEAVDRVVARFDADPGSDREPLDVLDLRDAAVETTRAAEALTGALELTNGLLESDAIAARSAELAAPLESVVDRAFRRALLLLAIGLVGLALLRLLPRRAARA